MGQPVMDTLRLSNRLRESGVEPGQAEAMAGALGAELDEHVAVRKDLDAGFDGVRSEIALTRSNLEADIDATRSNLDARIDSVRAEIALLRTEFNTKFNWGFGLMLAFLSVLVGMGWIDLNKPTPAPAPAPATTIYVPWVVPGTAVAQPTPSAAGPVAPGPRSAESAPVPPAPG